MTNEERVESYLRRIAPRSASNAEIVRGTGIQPYQQVFQITQRLLQDGRIKAGRQGNTWRFWCDARAVPNPSVATANAPMVQTANAEDDALAYRRFEELARQVMSRHYGTRLTAQSLPDVPKTFDFVSADQTIVGDAKFYSLVRGNDLPPAKFSVVAEHVWLLERCRSMHKFLVFGNDRRVPLRWLDKYGMLNDQVEFFFLDADGTLSKLA
jgi:hypothetical protein